VIIDSMDEVYQLGSIALTVRSLDDHAARGLVKPFVALVPALDLTRLPATMQIVIPLIDAGCADLILAGPRAEAFQQQIVAVIQQQGAQAGASPLVEVGDACHAALLGAVVHKAAVALCADEPEMLVTLRGVAAANGWTLMSSATPAPAVGPVAPRPAAARPARAATRPAEQTAKPAAKPTPKQAKPAKPKARAAKPKPKSKPSKPKKRR
jgi:hypothetical protein